MSGEQASEAVAFLREQGRMLRDLAAGQAEHSLRADLIALAERCEALARHMSGNGHDAARSPVT